MAQQKIYLRKVRDFGENLGDTFQYIRQEFKPLVKSFLLISGVFILGASILAGIYQMQLSTAMDRIDTTGNFPAMFLEALVTPTYFLFILMAIIGMVAMNITVASYMKLYDLSGVSPTLEEVWNEFRKYFLRGVILSILTGILIGLGLLLCILPGIYLAVVFMPAVIIIVNEDASVGEAFNRCFELIKENFWMSLGIYVVAYIIYAFAAGIIGAVLGVIIGVGSYMSTKEVGSTMAIVNSVSSVFGYLFYIVFSVAVAINYYTLTEKQEGVGMMRRLETLGSNDQQNSTEEQY